MVQIRRCAETVAQCNASASCPRVRAGRKDSIVTSSAGTAIPTADENPWTPRPPTSARCPRVDSLPTGVGGEADGRVERQRGRRVQQQDSGRTEREQRGEVHQPTLVTACIHPCTAGGSLARHASARTGEYARDAVAQRDVHHREQNNQHNRGGHPTTRYSAGPAANAWGRTQRVDIGSISATRTCISASQVRVLHSTVWAKGANTMCST